MNQDERFDADTEAERNREDAERFADAANSGASETETDKNDTEEPQIVETNLTDELEKERARSAEYLDQAQRTRAELINYRRRTEQEMQVARRFAAEHLIARILPVIDDFHRAIDAVPDADKDNPWVQGVRLIERKIWSVLESEGVQPIDTLGKPFDPSIHEAVSVDSDGGDMVVEEFQRGYKLHDRVVRPAMVKVGRAKSSEQTSEA